MTEKELLLLLSDGVMTNEEIGRIVNRAAVTVSRWRKKLGIRIKPGAKPGRPRPHLRRGFYRKCKKCSVDVWVTSSTQDKRFYCSKGCLFSCDEYRHKISSFDRSYMRTERYSLSRRKPNTKEYVRYRNKVHRLTKTVYQQFKEEINPNDYKRTVAGVSGGYHLDHKMSIKHGFLNNIKPEQLAVKENLQMLPWRDNISKGTRVS